MAQVQSINRFNNVVSQFGEKMAKTFPKDPDAIIFQSRIDVTLALSKWTIYNKFVSHVLNKQHDYRNRIMNNDEQFFMENKIDEENSYIEKSLQLRKKWKNLKPENKKMIFKYFQVLILLAERVQKEKM